MTLILVIVYKYHLFVALLFATVSLSILAETPLEESLDQYELHKKCIVIDSSSTYVCTSYPEKVRHELASSQIGDGSFVAERDGNLIAITSPYDMDLGVKQRIAGSEAEKERIYRVLDAMHLYFEDEVLSRSEYEHVRGKCKNKHELCAFWASVGECETNRGFMVNNCAATCRLCLIQATNMMA